MRSLLGTFSVTFLALSLVFVVLILRDSSFKIKHIEQIENISILTKLPGISLSTSFLDNRIPFYEEHANNFYLNMDVHRYTDFIYVK